MFFFLHYAAREREQLPEHAAHTFRGWSGRNNRERHHIGTIEGDFGALLRAQPLQTGTPTKNRRTRAGETSEVAADK